MIVFCKKQTAVNIDEAKKLELIQDYLAIAKKYISIPDIYFIRKRKDVCENCGKDEFDESGMCLDCGHTREEIDSSQSYADVDRVSMSKKTGGYEQIERFKGVVKQYQGKTSRRIDPSVFEDLEREFDKNHLVNKKGKTTHEKYSRITIDHIRTFLKKTGHSNYYDEIYYLYHYYTGNPLPDLSKYEPKLFSDFEKILWTYNSLPKTIRKRRNLFKNFYILFQLLRRYGFKFKKREFELLKSHEKLMEYDNIYEIICKKLGWEFEPMA